jgi:ferredoxin
LFGNLTLLVLDPLTLVFRAFASSLWPALDQVVTALERAAYRVEALRPAVAWLESFIRPVIFPVDPVHAGAGIAILLLLAAIVGLNWLAPRFWCRALCPLGGLLALASKAAIVRRQVETDCSGCGACVRQCPTGTIREDRGFASDPAECTVCMDCIDGCVQQVNSFRAATPMPSWESYDPNRRQALAAMGAGILGVGLLAADPWRHHTPPHRLRPPGVDHATFLRACIRCGACVRACPTAALNPALVDSGWEGIWSPVLIPRLGYCDYACNACGQVCPVQAIPPLSLEAKRMQVIGAAYIDHNRCLAWADDIDCIVCEEMCPVPEKAITLQTANVLRPDGAQVEVKRPRVDRLRCIGCGICEYKCPVVGEAAIRVHVAEAPFPIG